MDKQAVVKSVKITNYKEYREFRKWYEQYNAQRETAAARARESYDAKIKQLEEEKERQVNALKPERLEVMLQTRMFE